MSFPAPYLTESTQGPKGTALVVGAGAGSQLPAWRALGFKRLITVEADPSLAEQLARRVDASRDEEVWSRALTPEPTPQATLHVFNNPRFSSLKPANGIEKHYPNLREVSRTTVPAQTLEDGIRSLSLSAQAAHLLVLDTPGLAHTLLAATPPELLQAFTWIQVHGTRVPLYTDETGPEATIQILHDLGFDPQTEDTEAIPPHKTLLLQRNDARIRTAATARRLRELEELCTRQERQIGDQTAKIAALSAERDQQAQLAQEHKATLDKATANLQQQNKDHEQQLAKLTTERDQHAKLAQEHKAALDKATTDLQQQDEGHKQQLAKLTAERDQQLELVEEHREQLEQARQAVTLSVRLQTLREADLQELQGRHQALRDRYVEQQQLLKRVSEKLNIAANYFHQLTADDPKSGAELTKPRPRSQRSRRKSGKD